MKHKITINHEAEGIAETLGVDKEAMEDFSSALLAQVAWDGFHPKGEGSYLKSLEKALKDFDTKWEPTKPEHYVYLGYALGMAKSEFEAAKLGMTSIKKSRNPLAGLFS